MGVHVYTSYFGPDFSCRLKYRYQTNSHPVQPVPTPSRHFLCFPSFQFSFSVVWAFIQVIQNEIDSRWKTETPTKKRFQWKIMFLLQNVPAQLSQLINQRPQSYSLVHLCKIITVFNLLSVALGVLASFLVCFAFLRASPTPRRKFLKLTKSASDESLEYIFFITSLLSGGGWHEHRSRCGDLCCSGGCGWREWVRSRGTSRGDCDGDWHPLPSCHCKYPFT